MNSRSNHKCRVCYQPLPKQYLWRFDKMPASAQHLPNSPASAKSHAMTLDLYQCEGCGVVQTDAQPVSYYRETIRANSLSPTMTTHRTSQFKNWINDYKLNKKNILEIGSGSGEHLSLLEDLGVNAKGIEGNQESAKIANSKKLKTTHGFLGDPNTNIEKDSIDGFLCLNYLEHMPDPGEVLRKIRLALREGGVGLIEVPNFSMMQDNGQYSEFIADHLTYFTKESLNLALSLSGFDIIHIGSHWDNYILSAVVKKRKTICPNKMYMEQKKLNDEIQNYCQQYIGETIVLWGAGHQALAVLATSPLGSYVKYIVDSAPFKQGKFAPSSGQPIVPPSDLHKDTPKAIIVAAAGYNEEIIDTIKMGYPTIKSIAKISGTSLITL